MKNLDIFICAYKKFDCPVKDESYKFLSLGNNTELYGDNIYRDDTLDNVSDLNLFYSELSGYYWIYKNYDIKDYIGFCHYRRYFTFFDNVPDMYNEDCDIIVPSPLILSQDNMYNQYKRCHNIEDLEFVAKLMIDKYNVPKEVVIETLHSSQQMFCFNMFVTSKDIFKEYCELFFNICNDYLNHYNIKTQNDIIAFVDQNKEKYLKSTYPGNDIKYQSRIGGFLSERIFNIFVKWKQLKIKDVGVNLTEVKYEQKTQNDFI